MARRRGAYPVARLHQPLLEGWELTDASGIIDTVTDDPINGYTDILTTATAGTAYFTKPLKNYLGGGYPSNLLTYSEDFTNAIWVHNGIWGDATANHETDPLGTTTASRTRVLAADAAGNKLLRHNITLTNSGTYTLSFWAKRGSVSAANLYIAADLGDSGFLGTTILTTEWQQFTIVGTAGTGDWFDILLIGHDGVTDSEFYFWGASIQEGDVGARYVKTEGTPIEAGSTTSLSMSMFVAGPLSGDLASDYYMIGMSDNADPTAGGALWEAQGIRVSATAAFRASCCGNETTAVTSSSSTAASGSYHQGTSVMFLHPGRTGLYQQCYGWKHDPVEYKFTRQLSTHAGGAWVPTHLVAVIHQNLAAVATHRVEYGYFIGPPLGDIAIAPRKV